MKWVIVLFIYDSITNVFMKTSKKVVSDKLKKVRIEKKTDEEFPPSNGIQKQPELPKKSNKRKSHKAIQ
jgi:hypothetical protein